jgi:hypothetical protein
MRWQEVGIALAGVAAVFGILEALKVVLRQRLDPQHPA